MSVINMPPFNVALSGFGPNEVATIFNTGSNTGIKYINTSTGGSFGTVTAEDLNWFTTAVNTTDTTYLPLTDSVVFCDSVNDQILEVGVTDKQQKNIISSINSGQTFSSIAWDASNSKFFASHVIGSGFNGQWYDSPSFAGLGSHASPTHSGDLYANPVTNTVRGMAIDETTGNIWVVEDLVFTVSEINPLTGALVSSFTASGDWSGNFPQGILVKNDEIIIVSAFGPSKIAKYNKSGTLLAGPTTLSGPNHQSAVGLIG